MRSAGRGRDRSGWGREPLHSEAMWMEELLHDLCQPLTALQCRLFLATMTRGEARADEMEQAVADALKQCDRAIGLVRLMQERVLETEGVKA